MCHTALKVLPRDELRCSTLSSHAGCEPRSLIRTSSTATNRTAMVIAVFLQKLQLVAPEL